MSELFSPLALRDLTLKNRLMVSPMCQYSSVHGFANDWHLVHLGRFAIGGFGLVMVEATGVVPEGRISYGCLGLWDDAQIEPLRRIVDFLHANGSAAAIQLAHAGRKASDGVHFRPVLPESAEELEAIGYEDWQPVAPSAVPHAEGWKIPHELSQSEIAGLVQSFADAAVRAEKAGFDIVEIHGAHGYLIDQFLSPLANKRTDEYGGSRENRMRFALEVVEAVRAVWPAHKPLFMRLSVQDWHPDGWQVEDSVELAKHVKALGVDLIDSSSGGFDGAKIEIKPGYQVPLAHAVREGAEIATAAVGLIDSAETAERVIAGGDADLVALARPALNDPNWPIHAARELDGGEEPYSFTPPQSTAGIKGLDRILGRYRER